MSKRKKHTKDREEKKHIKRKRKHNETNSETSESDSGESKKLKKTKRMKKEKKKRHHSASSTDDSHGHTSRSKHKKKIKKNGGTSMEKTSTDMEAPADIPIELMDNAKKMAPMTKEEWEKQQSIVKRVYDESTGRHRLIRGDGEVIEEIVSRDRHKIINQQATKGDGNYFQTKLGITNK